MHLDLAYNVLGGRDLDLTVAQLREKESRESESAMVTLPELQRGGIAIVGATIFVGTRKYDGDTPIYDPPAPQRGREQLEIYQGWERDGKVRIIRTAGDLKNHLDVWVEDQKPGLVLLMESADSIESPDKLGRWFDAGVRIIGPAWGRTRYCGGTRGPGGLTGIGRELIVAMKDLGIVLDISHMAEESFWEALDLGAHRVIASHSNVRSITGKDDGQRHLTDEMITAIGERDGVIGIVTGNQFLDANWTAEKPPLDWTAAKKHWDHMANLIGWDHVGIGTDLDGGFGLENTPTELNSIADLRTAASVVPEEHRSAVLGGNWLRFLSESLPAHSAVAG